MARTLHAIMGPLFAASLIFVATPAPAQQAGKPLASRELDVEGIVAEVIESSRKEGELTVRVRFRNNGSKSAKLPLVDAQGYVHTYLVSGNTKYPLLKDTTGKELATPRDGGGWLQPTIKPKAAWSWWGKFPAPPADRGSYALYLKVGPPIEEIPIVDR